jgi:hypothetical protein
MPFKSRLKNRVGSLQIQGAQNYATIQTSNQDSTAAYSSSNFGGRKIVSKKGGSKLRSAIAESHQYKSALSTAETPISSKKLSSFGPGPGAYNFKSMFPNGPKYVI